MSHNRRHFLGSSSIALFGILPIIEHSKDYKFGQISDGEISSPTDPNQYFPSHHPKDVQAIVGASHSDLEAVSKIVTARPELAKASIDWGFGDWESALGAASHVGRKDIAEVLIEHGARPNIFTFAMLGHLEAVTAMIESMPGVQRIPGPHGISLMSHADMRLRRNLLTGADKERQEALVEYLKSLGDADVKAISLDISSEEQKKFLGKYKFGEGTDELLEVTLNSRGLLSINRAEQFGRALNRTAENTFAPGGAPSVKIQFEIINGIANSLSVLDPVEILKATRI